MKKITAIILAIMLAAVFAACGAEKTESTAENPEIRALYDKGFTPEMTTYDETMWAGIFTVDGDFGEVYYVKATINSEKYEEMNAIEFDDEEGKKSWIMSLTDAMVTNISELVPAQEELDEYIGKKFSELEEEGYEKTGYSGGEGEWSFYFDGPMYTLSVKAAEKIEDMDDYSENDIRELTVAAVEFNSFSGEIFEQ